MIGLVTIKKIGQALASICGEQKCKLTAVCQGFSCVRPIMYGPENSAAEAVVVMELSLRFWDAEPRDADTGSSSILLKEKSHSRFGRKLQLPIECFIDISLERPQAICKAAGFELGSQLYNLLAVLNPFFTVTEAWLVFSKQLLPGPRRANAFPVH